MIAGRDLGLSDITLKVIHLCTATHCHIKRVATHCCVTHRQRSRTVVSYTHAVTRQCQSIEFPIIDVRGQDLQTAVTRVLDGSADCKVHRLRENETIVGLSIKVDVGQSQLATCVAAHTDTVSATIDIDIVHGRADATRDEYTLIHRIGDCDVAQCSSCSVAADVDTGI